MQARTAKDITMALRGIQAARDLHELEGAELALKTSVPPSFLGGSSVQDLLYSPTGARKRARLRKALQAAGIKRVPLAVSEKREPSSTHPVKAPKLEDLFGGELGNSIETAFRHMGIAEQEISEAMRRHPSQAALINSQFITLATPKVLENKHDEMYKWHVYELLERVHSHQPLKYATKAEMLAHLSEMSLKAPLRQEWAMVYERLFNELFPQHFRAMFGRDALTRESWPGQYAEDLEKMRGTFRVESRKLQPVKPVTKLSGQAKAKPGSKYKTLLDYF